MATPHTAQHDKNTPLIGFEQVRDQEREAIRRGQNAGGSPAHADTDFVGLALSGGGIRSATFCLGVIQALAKGGKLVEFDYLSTVSGGGYIGSWLTAWIHRKGLSYVDNALKSQSLRTDGYVEAPEVTWLRQYSNYLAPQLGALSADSMTLVATWCRNVMLNLIALVSFLAVCFLLPRLLLVPTITAMHSLWLEVGYAASWTGFFLFPLGIAFQLSRAMSDDRAGKVELMNTTWGVLLLVIFPGLLTALLGSMYLFAPRGIEASSLIQMAAGAIVLLLLSGILWLGYELAEGHTPSQLFPEALAFLLAYVVAIAIGVVLVSANYHAFKCFIPDPNPNPNPEIAPPAGHIMLPDVMQAAALLCFGPPMLLVTFGVVGSVIVGLVGMAYFEQTREWWSRMNAWFAILGVVWLGLFGLAFYAVPIVMWAVRASGPWISAVLGASWVGSLLSTLLVPRASKAERGFGKVARELALDVALGVVVAGLLIGVAAGVGATVELAARPSVPPPDTKLQPIVAGTDAHRKTAAAGGNSTQDNPSIFTEALRESLARQTDALNTGDLLRRFGSTPAGSQSANSNMLDVDLSVFILLLCGTILLIFGIRVDVNKFSLHNLYKNRLVRCYLGASRYDERKPHPFTGFDEEDDVALVALQKAGNGAQAPVRPVHILNAAINITHGANLAWQERKAASFTFSPWHCGFTLGPSTGDADSASALSADSRRTGGYREAGEWASRQDEQKQFTLGMAMATSGAAVSAIQGKGSKPALAFIATIFNARLGRWSPNPLWRRGWRRSSPRFGLIWLLQELFGYATEVSNYVYLSDGGHFDNTGIYELVRRRCMKIVAVDATADGERAMADLANVVRKCRVDFGVNIEIDIARLGTARDRQSKSMGFVVGKINYPPLPNEKNNTDGQHNADGRHNTDGQLVVIKPTLVRLSSLGVDVYGYSRSRDAFPHQSTVDQFFSESQFESYRELGERIATHCLNDADFPPLRQPPGRRRP
ncbi:patatin-like phospholipase family protein [Paraburkholderia pallida]|uniref:PNPLA domain-containing protein n=1 Tax=Paraburkholderia pallida TaxID=2547399 RepID=A0A4P7D2T9_9BURK|nr:patatin-like phospholipase family protein [Paraburkholderia pallida]QBR01537.1 hypothetical protein E1956_30625 [Paraburkholderia pallida]